jgi:hypothetical protein
VDELALAANHGLILDVGRVDIFLNVVFPGKIAKIGELTIGL